jgi:translation initiation factor 2 beta subunit (eIF-2beta)/eIF-5
MSKLLKRFANIFTKKPHSNTETTGEIRFIFDSNLSATQAKYKATSHEQRLQRTEQQERQEITAIQEQHQIMDESLYEKYIAVNEFKKKANEDIDINVNDQLLLLHKTYPDFYSVRNLRTQKNGFVPSNCIKPMNAMNSKTDSVKE